MRRYAYNSLSLKNPPNPSNPPKNGNKLMFFNELNLSLNQCVNKYDNIIVMGDLNIHISDKRKGNSNFLPELCDTFSLQNIITRNTCHKSKSGT